jgi:RNA polymerase sigma-70 factor (ECF subfamily)
LALPTVRTLPLAPLSATAAPLDIASLYRAYATRVARWAGHLGGPAVEADDVVQEVFLVARRRLPEFRGDTNQVTTWLFRVTQKIVQSVRRRQRVRRWLLGAAEHELAGMGSGGPDPDAALESRRKIASVYTVLDTLSRGQRQVLILFEVEGLSTQAIADLIGVRLGTVRVRLHRARARFLEEYERRFSQRADVETARVASGFGVDGGQRE